MMDIRGIQQEAQDIYVKYRKQIIPEYFYVGYLGILAQYLRSGLFSFFVSLFLCPIAHGYVKCAMKLVDEQETHIDYHESLVGILQFQHVAPAYLMRKAFILLVVMLCFLPSFLTIRELIPEFSLEWFSSLGNALIQTEYFIPNFQYMFLILQESFLVVNLIVCAVVYLFLTGLLMPVPYVMESEEFSWSECIHYSIRLMKHHIFSYAHLYLFYIFRHGFYWIVTGLVVMWVGRSNELALLFCMVASLFLYIEAFKGRFEIAKYLFYKQIKKSDYEK